jgi:hypothetical protein
MATNPPSDTRPALWNPNAAACWSLLFTPAFGAYLHARNADTLGRTQEAKANRICFYASLGFLAFVLFSIFIPQIPESVCRAAGIGLLIGWYVSTGKVQAQYVTETWQKSYTRKPWTKPLLLAVNCLIGYVLLVIAVGIVADVFFGIQ